MDDKPATVPRVEVGSLASLRLVFAVEAIACLLAVDERCYASSLVREDAASGSSILAAPILNTY